MPRLPAPACSQAPLGASCCCCKRCNMGGCDLRALDCGCCFHARCCPVSENNLMTQCPLCSKPVRALTIMPMTFDEIDQAQREAASTALTEKRGKKRKNATIARLNASVKECMSPDNSVELRAGRWTPEETDYCDKLIELFEKGQLPIPDGCKLNDFLSNMLKSKQSRLTKKMKNAKLSARLYQRNLGYIERDEEALAFSRLETEFFASIKCNMERSEIRFHMQKEWRELFSAYCVSIGQKLDAHDWMSSVEELDRRVSMQNDAARMLKRKIMMGQALEKDMEMNQVGVFIDRTVSSSLSLSLGNLSEKPSGRSNTEENSSSNSLEGSQRSSEPFQGLRRQNGVRFSSSGFTKKVIEYLHRHNVPFEHVDVWVPSFTAGNSPEENATEQKQNCRLFFAGFGTSDTVVPPEGGQGVPMSSDDIFDLLSYGVYSEKFSFDVGFGLPGRVYSTGVSSWEQGIQNAPQSQFERCGGAQQWGIQTVLGIPIPSPNVGRVVVLFYSKHDRQQSVELVNRIAIELKRLMPTPRWKLIVDVGCPTPSAPSEDAKDLQLQYDLLNIITAHTPVDKASPLSAFLPGFTSLRLLLNKQDRTEHESDLIRTIIRSFASYKQAARREAEIAAMVARDFMLLTKSQPTQHTNDSASSSNNGSTSVVDQSHDTKVIGQQLVKNNNAWMPCQGSNYPTNSSTDCGGTASFCAPSNTHTDQAQNSPRIADHQQICVANQENSYRFSPTMFGIPNPSDFAADDIAPLTTNQVQGFTNDPLLNFQQI